MIRIYLDTNVINGIREGKLDQLKTIIDANRDKILLTYSQAHVSDKFSSIDKRPDLFWRDIDFLTLFTDSNYIQYEKKNGQTMPLNYSARDAVEDVKEGNEFIKHFSVIDNMVNFFKEGLEDIEDEDDLSQFQEHMSNFEKALSTLVPNTFSEDEELVTYKYLLQKSADSISEIRENALKYKNSRDSLLKEFKLPSHITELNENDAYEQINILIQKHGEYDNFLDLVTRRFNMNVEETTPFAFFLVAYLALGLIGYLPDEINLHSNKGIGNHLNDAEHAFYGGHCDFFVSNDLRLRKKTKVLYKNCNVHTKVVTSEEMILELNRLVVKTSLSNIIKLIVETEPIDTGIEDGITSKLYRLPYLAFDHFTHVQIDDSDGKYTLMFLKRFPNYSNFLFNQEFEFVIRKVHEFSNSIEDIQTVIREMNPTEGVVYKDYLLADANMRLSCTGADFYLFLNLF